MLSPVACISFSGLIFFLARPWWTASSAPRYVIHVLLTDLEEKDLLTWVTQFSIFFLNHSQAPVDRLLRLQVQNQLFTSAYALQNE